MKIELFLAAVLCARAAFAVSDHSIAEFPRHAGEADDAPRFQRAVDACYGGGLLIVPGGNYTLAHTILVTNLCSIEMSPGARIKAVAEMEWMIKINQMWQYNPKTAPKDVETNIYNLSYRGGTLDADGKASCLAIDNYKHFTLKDATFLNGRNYGVAVEKEGLGYEMIAHNLYFKTVIPGLAGNTALFTNGGDSQYTDIIVVDYTVGFNIANGGANRLTRCHVWGGPVKPPRPGELPEMLEDSVCFRITGSGTILRDCYADTGAIGYWISGHETQMFGCYYFNNVGFGLKDVTIIRQDGGTLYCDGNCLRRNTPETRLYSGSPKAKVYWGASNIFPGFGDGKPAYVPAARAEPPPIDIDGARQLVVDDELFVKNSMKRIWHRPMRRARPVASVALDGGVFYEGWARRYVGWSGDGAVRMESADGLEWIVAGGGLSLGIGRPEVVRVTLCPDALDHKPFKAFAWRRGIGGFVLDSADGLAWGRPVRTVAGGDLTSIFYNPFTRFWGYSFRDSSSIGKMPLPLEYHEADSFFGGAKTRPPARDGRLKCVPTPWIRESKPLRGKTAADFRAFSCMPYESVLIGLAQVVMDGKDTSKGTDLWLAFARNRWFWSFPKPAEGEAFIAQTHKGGNWDCKMLAPNPGVCVAVGDELRFYYSGFSGAGKAATGFATLRRDGFCSVQDGEIRTKPLVFSKGDRLWVNVDARQGELTVRIAGHNGKNFGEQKISGQDATRIEVGAVESNNPFSLVFTSKGGAKLYSFWADGAEGRSDGCLAGGSPGDETLRDESNERGEK